jgi:hypothetical protein
LHSTCALHTAARAAALQASAQLACAGDERVRHVALLQPFNIYQGFDKIHEP